MKLKAFTVRLPEELLDKLEERRAKNRRKRNDEIILILETVLLSPSEGLS